MMESRNDTIRRDLTHIDNVEELRQEAKRLEHIIHMQETALKVQLKSLPGEAVKAAVKGVVPAVVAGKLTGMAFNAGTSLIAGILAPKATAATAAGALLSGSLRKAGWIALFRLASKWLLSRKKKRS